jgi:hypothetical protein
MLVFFIAPWRKDALRGFFIFLNLICRKDLASFQPKKGAALCEAEGDV